VKKWGEAMVTIFELSDYAKILGKRQRRAAIGNRPAHRHMAFKHIH
jgi:hypothetical protein